MTTEAKCVRSRFGSGLAGRRGHGLAVALLRLQLLLKQAVEVDRLEQEGREAAVAHGVGDDAAREGEQDARRFGEEEGLKLVLGNVADAEQAGMFQLDDKAGDFGLLRGHVDRSEGLWVGEEGVS